MQTCSASDFVDGCSNPTYPMFTDPLVEAQSWVFEQINLRPVWESGLSKCVVSRVKTPY